LTACRSIVILRRWADTGGGEWSRLQQCRGNFTDSPGPEEPSDESLHPQSYAAALHRQNADPVAGSVCRTGSTLSERRSLPSRAQPFERSPPPMPHCWRCFEPTISCSCLSWCDPGPGEDTEGLRPAPIVSRLT